MTVIALAHEFKYSWQLASPLNQFDLIEKRPTCEFNFLSSLIGMSNLEEVIVYGFGFILLWQLYDFYNTENNYDYIKYDLEIDVKALLRPKNFNYTSILLSYFTLIFFNNVSGLMPYAVTLTANLILTLCLSSITMLTVWLHSFFESKMAIFNHFVPKGTPLLLISFIILIEWISNLSRVISLAVRLFANMTSGHALLKILASFSLNSLILMGIWKILALVPFIIVLLVTLLELLVAFLQTYVFITLWLIYISEIE